MKIKILIVSILAMSILTLLPSISALEYDATVKANEEYITEMICENNINPEKTGIIRCMIKFILKLIIRLILLPIKIAKLVLTIVVKLCIKLFCLPFKILGWIIDLLTPFLYRMTS